MKIKFLITGILSLVTIAAFAQKRELENADDKFKSYDIARLNKLTMSQAVTDLTDAKTSIDKASANEKTGNLTQTYALKGVIYAALAIDTTQKTSQPANLKTATEALAKAKSMDSVKNEYKKTIDEGYSFLAQYSFDQGRLNFSAKKYVDAYNSFSAFKQYRAPGDTLAAYVVGLSAGQAGVTDPKYNQIAITNYKELVAAPVYNNKPEAYSNLTALYLTAKDTTDAYKTVMEGMQKFPANGALRDKAIVIGLQSGKTDELITTIQSAITAEPNRKELHYYLAITYSEIADNLYAREKKGKTQADKDALEAQVVDNCNKAAAELQKAMAIDPNYGSAAITLSYVSMKPVTDLFNSANQLPTSAQKQYDAAMAKVQTMADAAKPAVLKAVELNPNSPEALTNLKNFYLIKKDMADANATQKKIEALPGK